MKNVFIIGISVLSVFILYQIAMTEFKKNIFQFVSIFGIERTPEYANNPAIGMDYGTGISLVGGETSFSSVSPYQSSPVYAAAVSVKSANFHVTNVPISYGNAGSSNEHIAVSPSFVTGSDAGGYANSKTTNSQPNSSQQSVGDATALFHQIKGIFKKSDDTQGTAFRTNSADVSAMFADLQGNNQDLFVAKQNIGGPEDDGDPVLPTDTIPVGEGIWTLLFMAMLYIAWKVKAFSVQPLMLIIGIVRRKIKKIPALNFFCHTKLVLLGIGIEHRINRILHRLLNYSLGR